MKKTIMTVLERRLCLGCGTCYAVCPENAIVMVYSSKNRTYVPELNEKICSKCGICYEVCPGLKIKLRPPEMGEQVELAQNVLQLGAFIKCFLAYASDYQIRQNSTSGGIATALSIYALEKQLVDAVAGTRIKKGTINETETVLCRSRKDVESVKGSKYCPAAANCVFRKAAEENVGSLMFVGLPCHIQGLYRARKVKPLKEIKSLLTIGLLCGGMSGQEATEWILKRYGIDRDKVKAITCYRGRGFPGKMVVEINGNQEIEIPYLDYYDEYFESWRPWRCLLCLDRSSQLADISLGDAWLPEVMSEPAGTSIIIARTKEGMNLIENAIKDGVISCEVASSETILKSQQGLWKEIEQKVKETLDLCKTVRKSIPSHDVDIPSQSLTKRARRLKYLLRMTMLRKMSTSPVFFFWIESLRKAKAAALAMVKST